jgi:hypothetical protein
MHFNVKLRKSMHIHVLSRTSYSFTCIFALVHADYTGLHVFVRTFHTFIRTFVLSYAHSSYLYTHNAFSYTIRYIFVHVCTFVHAYLYILSHLTRKFNAKRERNYAKRDSNSIYKWIIVHIFVFSVAQRAFTRS